MYNLLDNGCLIVFAQLMLGSSQKADINIHSVL